MKNTTFAGQQCSAVPPPFNYHSTNSETVDDGFSTISTITTTTIVFTND